MANAGRTSTEATKCLKQRKTGRQYYPVAGIAAVPDGEGQATQKDPIPHGKEKEKWRRNYQKQHSENTLTTSDQQFIELQLPRKEKTITLQKVELLFDNHKCCIEGKLGSSQLLKLVALIEEAAAC